MRLALLLVLLSLASGCISAEAKDVPGPKAVDAPREPSTERVEATVAQQETADSEEVVTLASWDGSTTAAACGPTMCQIVQEGANGWTELDTLGAPGTLTQASGVLTWTAETPLTAELRVFVFGLDPTGMPVDVVETVGPSPLSFDVALTELDGVAFAFSIHGHHEVGPVLIETAQPFHMDAEIHSIV